MKVASTGKAIMPVAFHAPESLGLGAEAVGVPAAAGATDGAEAGGKVGIGVIVGEAVGAVVLAFPAATVRAVICPTESATNTMVPALLRANSPSMGEVKFCVQMVSRVWASAWTRDPA